MGGAKPKHIKNNEPSSKKYEQSRKKSKNTRFDFKAAYLVLISAYIRQKSVKRIELKGCKNG